MRRIFAAALPLCLIVLSLTPAAARPRHRHVAVQHSAEHIVCDDRGCSDRTPASSQAGRGAQRSTPAVDTMRVAGGRPAGCPPRWCGCWLGRHLGLTDRRLWRASAWAGIGSPAGGPAPGVIAVWPHHVGQVTSVPGVRTIVLLSGNDGHAVRERARSAGGVIAWRRVS